MTNYKQVREPNLDPVIYQPNGHGGSYILGDWLGWCLAYVSTAFQSAPAGPDAWTSWTQFTASGHTDREWPVNVKIPVWFSGYKGLGHVAILQKNAQGGLTIWSSPITNKAHADVWTSIEQVESRYGVRYAGWSEDVGGTRVIEPVIQEVTMVDENFIRAFWIDLFGTEPDDNQKKQYIGKPWEEVYNDLRNSKAHKDRLAVQEQQATDAEKWSKFGSTGDPKLAALGQAIKEFVKE